MNRRKQRKIIGLKRAAVTLLAFVMLLSICSPSLTALAAQLDTPDTGLDSPNLLQTVGENSDDTGTDGSGENSGDSGDSGDSGTDGSGENSVDSGTDGSGENSGDSGSNGSGENSGDFGNDGSGENAGDSGSDGSGENSDNSGNDDSGENSESGTESDSAGTEGTEETGAARLNAYLNQLAKLEEEATYLEADEEVLDNFYFDGLLAVWDAAQEDWGNDLLTDEQMDEINLKAYGIKMYLQNELHYVDGDIVTYDNDINTVPSATANNVTVKVFNYDNDVNSKGLGLLGYNFFQGNYTDDEKEGSVDGVYSASHGNYNRNNKPVMSKTLVNGYPYVERKADNSKVNISGSMDYLFDETYLKGTMYDGGGLFRKDANGYFYYDSMWNAASYSNGKFTLYDTVVRPNYTADTGSDIQRSNFLPFNDATNATVDCTIGETRVQGAKLNEPVDLWFGMTVDFSFFMPKDGKIGNDPMIFDFHGDDDVFVYIDDVLVLDIGGTHASQSGTINFNTGKVVYPNVETTLKALFAAAGKTDVAFNEDGTFVDYTSHTLKFYYMERGGNISYCRLRFNMPTIPDNSLLVGKELEIDSGNSTDLKNYLDSKYDYQFRVWKCNETGNEPELLAKEGDTYDILQNGQKVGTGTVGQNGIFTLKAGTFAQFANLLAKDIFLRHYYVEEILPKEIHEQYGNIEFKIDGANDNSITGKVEGDYVHYYSSVISVSEDTSQKNSATVLYTNKVNTDNLSILQITKEVSAGSVSTDAEFPIQIKLGGEVLPTGSKYIVNGTEKTSEANGIIKLKGGETAMLADGIISGTKFAVREILTGDLATIWNASYSGTVTDSNGTNGLTGTENISGTFPLNSTVHVTVTNRSYDLSCEIPVTKTYLGNTNATKNFTFALKNSDGNIIDGAETTITVTDDKPTKGSITLGYKSDVEIGTYWYKLCEVVEENDRKTNYDPSIYDVEVAVSEENGKKTAVVKSITLNGTENGAAAFVNHRTTQVAVSKTVSGNMGDQSKEFTFTATLSGNGYSFDGVTYSINNGEAQSAGTETECTFNLKHGDSITFIDLPIGATFTVTETSYSESGYVTTVDGETGSSKVITLAETNSNIAFVNTKDVTIDTGVLLDTLPYILILGVVAVGAVLLIKRRRNRDDD